MFRVAARGLDRTESRFQENKRLSRQSLQQLRIPRQSSFPIPGGGGGSRPLEGCCRSEVGPRWAAEAVLGVGAHQLGVQVPAPCWEIHFEPEICVQDV